MDKVVSLAEHMYKKNMVHLNLALDNVHNFKGTKQKKNIRKEMTLGYMKLLSNYHQK